MSCLPSALEPLGPPEPVCEPGEFPFAAIGLDHGHIYGQCEGLIQAGGTLRTVFDPDPAKTTAFKGRFPDVDIAADETTILDDPELKLVTSAIIPDQRGALDLRVLDAGKDYFVDKAPFTTFAQLEAARQKVAETGKKHLVYYSERLHVESAVFAGQLIGEGVIGHVLQVLGLGPHKIGQTPRPDWFYKKEHYGGILCDIGSHQIEQFLFYSRAEDAAVTNARVENFAHLEYPELEDFGEASLVADNGTSNYFRVDWFTPQGLSTWGDGRLFVLGTEGTLELRKHTDVAREGSKDHLYLVTSEDEYHVPVAGKVGFPFFGELILDCLNRTEQAMTQAHTFKAAELALTAQRAADRTRTHG